MSFSDSVNAAFTKGFSPYKKAIDDLDSRLSKFNEIEKSQVKEVKSVDDEKSL